MKTKKILWGIFFIAAAVLVVVNQMEFFTGIGLWSLLFTVILIPILAYGIAHRNFFNVFFSIAFLLIIYAETLHIEKLVPWTVLIAALFLSIGFTVLIKPKKHWGHWIPGSNRYYSDYASHNNYHEGFESDDSVDGNNINCRAFLSGSSKYLQADSLQTGQFDCSLGELKIYFDNVTLHPDGATITVNCSLGSMVLYIPKSWNILLNIETSLGNAEEHGTRIVSDGPPLIIKGEVHLGNLDIFYI